MKTINTITQERIKFRLYPDNQPHVQITDIEPGDEVRVVSPIRTSLELVNFMQIASALDGLKAVKREAVIPYLMGARSDRRMLTGDSFDLEVVAACVNWCNFGSVNLFDVHSPVATELIHNSRSHNNSRLVKMYDRPNSILIVPDKGAFAKFQQVLAWNPNLIAAVPCDKERDLTNGRVTLKVRHPEMCEGKDCVIVDDLCDGGATFVAIAQQIKPSYLTLIVSHGIFSKGFGLLDQHFNHIITSDSYQNPHGGKNLTVLPLGL